MYDLSVTDVHGYMTDSAAALIEQKVAGLDGIQAYRSTYGRLCCCGTRKADAEVCHYGKYKTGTVCSVGQAGAAVYIRINYKLKCVAYNTLTNAGRAGA